MPRVRLTQAFTDRLLTTKPPARDVIHWCARMPGFGIVVKARSGVASFVIQWRDRDTGSSHRLVLARTSKVTLAAAREIARTRFAEIAAGKNPIAERRDFRAVPTFGGFVATYLASPAWTAKAPSTRRSDQGRLERYLLPALGRLRLTAITSDIVATLHRDLCHTGRVEALARRGGATKATRRGGAGGARATLRFLQSLLGTAVKQRMIVVNPAHGLELGSDGRRTAIPDAEAYGRLWAALEALRAAGGTMASACDVIGLIGLTGARKSEIRLLRWRHVDLEARELRLPASEHKGGRRTGVERVIALSDAAMAILAAHRRGLPDAFVFPGIAGSPVDLARPWKRIAAAAGLAPTITLHSLRHGIGSVLADAGMSALQVATALGHASSRTSERYCHVVGDARAVLAQRAAELVRPAKLRAVG